MCFKVKIPTLSDKSLRRVGHPQCLRSDTRGRFLLIRDYKIDRAELISAYSD